VLIKYIIQIKIMKKLKYKTNCLHYNNLILTKGYEAGILQFSNYKIYILKVNIFNLLC